MAKSANNYHCFEGSDFRYWRAIASGMRPTGQVSSANGDLIDLEKDIDGFVVQNGGMFAPQQTKLRPGNYFRFIGSAAMGKYGPASAVTGGWWIDFDNFLRVQDWAVTHDMPLSKAAQALLVIPNEWSDCGFVCRAKLNKTMKAWVGKGKPATGSISPDSKMRDKTKDPVVMSPAHLEMKQYFVPGERDLLKECFSLVNKAAVTRKGATLLGV